MSWLVSRPARPYLKSVPLILTVWSLTVVRLIWVHWVTSVTVGVGTATAHWCMGWSADLETRRRPNINLCVAKIKKTAVMYIPTLNVNNVATVDCCHQQNLHGERITHLAADGVAGVAEETPVPIYVGTVEM